MSAEFWVSLLMFVAIGSLFYDAYKRSRRTGVPLQSMFVSAVVLYELLMLFLMVSSFLD